MSTEPLRRNANTLEDNDAETIEPSTSLSKKYIGDLVSYQEAWILLLYPGTLVLGHILSLADIEPSYFSNKGNALNVIFVRQGWFWTTLAFAIHGYTTFMSTCSRKNIVARQQFVRYSLATLWWILFAQWCFGPPLMDRVFTLTGGYCDGSVGLEPSLLRGVSSSVCRSHGGSWIGGYDPSGHAFLMVHSSLFLWFEILPTLNKELEAGALSLSTKVNLALIALWWWMLLMTSVYFHSFLEKLAGLLWGMTLIFIVYVYRRKFPVLNTVFGKP